MDRLPIPIAGSISAGIETLLDHESPGDDCRSRAAKMQAAANAAELRDNIRRWLLILRPSAYYEYAGIRFFLWSNLFSDHPGDSIRISIERGSYMNLSQAVERFAQLREEQIETERRRREGGAS